MRSAIAELPEPGDYKAMDICGVPLLLTRQRDGSVGALADAVAHGAEHSRTGVSVRMRPGGLCW
mgnify:CR=1 FL=1